MYLQSDPLDISGIPTTECCGGITYECAHQKRIQVELGHDLQAGGLEWTKTIFDPVTGEENYEDSWANQKYRKLMYWRQSQ